MELDEDFVVSRETRKRLKGFSVRTVGDSRQLALENEDVVCVGDKTSENVLLNGIKPKICVYDGRIMREDVGISKAIRDFEARELRVRNPPGTLTRELFKAIETGFKEKGSFKIRVYGEEDLATLAAILLAPDGTKILYGQPKKGLVEMDVDDKIKREVEEILSNEDKRKKIKGQDGH